MTCKKRTEFETRRITTLKIASCRVQPSRSVYGSLRQGSLSTIQIPRPVVMTEPLKERKPKDPLIVFQDTKSRIRTPWIRSLLQEGSTKGMHTLDRSLFSVGKRRCNLGSVSRPLES